MPRQIGELRRLCMEWNDLVPLARARGISRMPSGTRINPRRHFHLDRAIARLQVAELRAQLAPFFAANQGAALSPGLADTFGIEIECLMGPSVTETSLAALIQADGVLCQNERYNHTTRTHWKVTTDGSLGYGQGREIVSPPLSGEAGFEALHKVCGVVTRTGGRINKDCGLHVHIGAQHRELDFFKNAVRMYHHFERAIDSFLAPSRRGSASRWCRPVEYSPSALDAASTVDQIAASLRPAQSLRNWRGSGRYCKFNLQPFGELGTVEFRQHQGTVEARKIEMWTRFLLRFCTKAAATSKEEIAAGGRDLASLITFIGLDEAEQAYVNERASFFAQREQRSTA